MKKQGVLLMALVLLLTGCGAKNTEEPVSVEVETTIVTEETTVPTEPKNWFEEQSYVLWENMDVTDTETKEGIPLKFAHPSIKNKMHAYKGNSPTFDASNEYISELVDSTTFVSLEEYQMDSLGTVLDQSVVDPIYEKCCAEFGSDLSREEWTGEFEDYVIKKFYIYMGSDEVSVASFMNKVKSQWSSWRYGVSVYTPDIIDMRNGSIYDTPETKMDVIRFDVTMSDGDQPVFAYMNYDASISQNGNFVYVLFLYAMMPENCDDLAFSWAVPVEALSGEEWEETMSNDSTEWEISSLDEKIAENPKYKFYFFQ